MNCPRCGRPVQEEDYICTRCGKRLRYPETLEHDLVFSQKDMPKQKKNIVKRIIIALIAAIVVCAVIIGAMIYLQREGGKENKAQTETTAAETQDASGQTASTGAEKSTTSPTAAPMSDEEKLYSYFRKSDLYEDLLAEADGNMRVDLTAERNVAIAKYTILFSSTDDEHQLYFETLDSFFDELCSKLDKEVYDMKKDSGVSNAELEITAVDLNGVSLYSKLID